MDNKVNEVDQWKNSKLFAFFRSPYWIGLTFMCITFGLMLHTAGLVLRITNIEAVWWAKWAYAFIFAFGFDSAILFFALTGRKVEAGNLVVSAFFINVCFFNLNFLYAITGGGEVTPQMWVNLIISILISGVASFIVHSYTSFFSDKLSDRDEKWALYKQVDDLKLQLKEAKLYREKEGTRVVDGVGVAENIIQEKNGDSINKVKEEQTSIKSFESSHQVHERIYIPISKNSGISDKITKAAESVKKIKCDFCPSSASSASEMLAIQGNCEICKVRKAEKSQKSLINS